MRETKAKSKQQTMNSKILKQYTDAYGGEVDKTKKTPEKKGNEGNKFGQRKAVIQQEKACHNV